MKINQLIKVLSLTLVLFTACSDDENGPSFFSDVLVINEGNFLSAEGSISGYNSSIDSTQLGIYENSNGFAISATVQRVESFNGNYIMTTNNPDKLEMLDVNDLALKNSIITDLATPFSFAGSGNIGFVTNWGTYNSATFQFENPFISVIDMTDFTVSSKIDWDFQPQDLLVIGSSLYISNVNSTSISIMDINSLDITGSIETPYGPDIMELDAEGDIWVICTSGNLVEIDQSTNEVKKTITGVSTSGFNEKMVFNASKDKLYFLSTVYDANWNVTTSVFECSTSASEAPATPLVESTSFYGIGIDDDVLYVGDHNNYQGNGTVFMFDLEGNELGSFESGIVPNGFIFR